MAWQHRTIGSNPRQSKHQHLGHKQAVVSSSSVRCVAVMKTGHRSKYLYLSFTKAARQHPLILPRHPSEASRQTSICMGIKVDQGKQQQIGLSLSNVSLCVSVFSTVYLQGLIQKACKHLSQTVTLSSIILKSLSQKAHMGHLGWLFEGQQSGCSRSRVTGLLWQL